LRRTRTLTYPSLFRNTLIRGHDRQAARELIDSCDVHLRFAIKEGKFDRDKVMEHCKYKLATCE